MSVVLPKGAHTHQAVQRAGKLVPVHQANLANAHRQLAVAVHIMLVG